MNAVLGSAVKIDNFFPMNAGVARDLFEIERELGLITNRNFDQRFLGLIGAILFDAR